MYTKPIVIRRAAAAAGICLTGLLLTACQAASTTSSAAATATSSAGGPASGAAAGATTGSANGSNGSNGSTASGAAQASAACRTGDLKASTAYDSAENSGSTLIAFLILTNASASTCTLDGYTGIDLLDPSGHSLGMTTSRVAPSNAQPGGVQTLAPGKTASEEFTFTFAANDQGNGCVNAVTIAAIPPNQTQALDTKLTSVKTGTVPSFGVCTSSITVFPIGPADQIPG